MEERVRTWDEMKEEKAKLNLLYFLELSPLPTSTSLNTHNIFEIISTKLQFSIPKPQTNHFTASLNIEFDRILYFDQFSLFVIITFVILWVVLIIVIVSLDFQAILLHVTSLQSVPFTILYPCLFLNIAENRQIFLSRKYQILYIIRHQYWRNFLWW